MAHAWWSYGAALVHGHTATWPDGLRVTRLATHRGRLWLEIEHAGVTWDAQLGPRTFRVTRQKAKRRKKR